MSDEYKCPVCNGAYEEHDVTSTICERCGCRVCVYCIEETATGDLCDKCGDEISQTTKGLTEHELADKWIEDMKASEYTYENMSKVFEIARQKYRRILEAV